MHTYLHAFICTIYVHRYTHIHTYTHSYICMHMHSYILAKSIAPNKIAYPALHEQYAVTIVRDFVTATQAMVNVVDH